MDIFNPTLFVIKIYIITVVLYGKKYNTIFN